MVALVLTTIGATVVNPSLGLLGPPSAGAGPADILFAAVSAQGAGDCSSPGDACSLASALARAPDGATVQLVTPGTQGIYQGGFTVPTSIAMQPAPGVTNPILDGGSTSSLTGTTVLDVTATGSVTLSGLTIQNGNGGSTMGGGVSTNSAALTVEGSSFIGDTASTAGGAILTTASLTVSGSTFSNDSTGPGGAGGAIDSTGTVSITSSTFSTDSGAGNGNGGAVSVSGGTVFTSTFVGDTAGENGNGGAIASSGPLTVSGSTFSTDTVGVNGNGGALFLPGGGAVTASTFSTDSAGVIGGNSNGGAIAAAGTLSVSSSSFSGDTAGDNGNGGAISLANGSVSQCAFSNDKVGDNGNGGAIVSFGPLGVSGSTFSANSVGVNGNGGALSMVSGSIDTSTFAGNDVGDQGSGGAISATSSSDPTSVTASTFSANEVGANGSGGAIFGIVLLVADSTFSRNLASANGGFGGAIAGGGTATVSASTFSGNTAALGNDLAGLGPETAMAADLFTGGCTLAEGAPDDLGFNVGVDTSCFSTPAAAGDQLEAGLAADLGPLTNAGGPTQTLPLLKKSGNLAVGLIPDSPTAVNGPGGALTLCSRTDQRGFASPPGGACDAGAFQTPSLAVTSQAGAPATSGQPFTDSVTLAGNDGESGSIVATLYGPVTPVGGQSCSSLSLSEWSTASSPQQFNGVIDGGAGGGNGTVTITGPPLPQPGCWAWGLAVTLSTTAATAMSPPTTPTEESLVVATTPPASPATGPVPPGPPTSPPSATEPPDGGAQDSVTLGAGPPGVAIPAGAARPGRENVPGLLGGLAAVLGGLGIVTGRLRRRARIGRR